MAFELCSIFSIFLVAGCLVGCCSAVNSSIPDESWGYVDVRESAHMFWWLYGCTDTSKQREYTPLVMWLQGGPGGSSTGFGNFGEIGPMDVKLNPRPTTWVQAANVLFVDNPVGSGYSYVDNDTALTTDVEEITKDLMTLFKAFLQKYPVFSTIPFYIFSESYGGKMSAAFSLALQTAINNGEVHCLFKGVALGDSWISPIDYLKTWGPYLLATSLVNEAENEQINAVAKEADLSISIGNFSKATDLFDRSQNIIDGFTDFVDVYNILQHNVPGDNSGSSGSTSHKILAKLRSDSLSDLMNGPIRQKLKIIPKNVKWGAQSGKVFEAQKNDFMKDVIGTVDSLLTMGVNVTVYNGQLDLICDTLGTIMWMNKLKWSGMTQFNSAKRIPLYPPSGKATGQTGAFLQSYQNLRFFYILKAGHMIPADAGEMALTMLEMVIT